MRLFSGPPDYEWIVKHCLKFHFVWRLRGQEALNAGNETHAAWCFGRASQLSVIHNGLCSKDEEKLPEIQVDGKVVGK